MRLNRWTLTAACAAILIASTGSPALAGPTDPAPPNTTTGKDITIRPIPDVKVIYNNVTQAGDTTAMRTDLAPGVRLSPCGTLIPSFLGLPAGDDHFTVFRIDTTAGFTDSIDLNFTHPDTNSRVFRAACPPPKVDPGWEDITTIPVPGDPRGRMPGFSEFVLATDPRPLSIVIANKYNMLKGIVAPGSPASMVIDPMTLATLQSMINDVGLAIAANNKPAAITSLQNLIMFVRAGSGTTIPNSASANGGNIAGRLESKAATLIFSLSL